MAYAVPSNTRNCAFELDADSSSRAIAVCSHLVCLVLPVPVVPQLIFWLLLKDKSPFIDDHGKEALNFQISIVLYAFIFGLLIFILIGIPLLIALPFFQIIFAIVAAIAAGRGAYYRYPMTIRLIN